MLPAVFGLIGVVIGALLSAGLQLLIESYRTRKAGRTAARLVTGALGNLYGFIGLALESNRLPPGWREVLQFKEWDEYRVPVAAATTTDEWVAVAAAAQWIALLRITPQLQGDAPKLDSSMREMLEETRGALLTGSDALRRVLYGLKRRHGKPGVSPMDSRLGASP